MGTTPRLVVEVELASATGLGSPEYRLGDVTGALAGAVRQRVYVQFKTENTLCTIVGENGGNGTVAWKDTKIYLQATTTRLAVEVCNNRPIAGCIRGDPRFGCGFIDLRHEEDEQKEHTVRLQLNGKPNGELRVCTRPVQRVVRKVGIYKTCLVQCGCDHWGVGLEVYANGSPAGWWCYEVSGQGDLEAPMCVLSSTRRFLSEGARGEWFQNLQAERRRNIDPNIEFAREKEHYERGGVECGLTVKSEAEMDQYVERWVQDHPVYKVLGSNCQTFALDFVQFLTGCDVRGSVVTDLHFWGRVAAGAAAVGTVAVGIAQAMREEPQAPPAVPSHEEPREGHERRAGSARAEGRGRGGA